MEERKISDAMVKKCLEKGTKYWNSKNGTFNYIIKTAKGNNLVVGQNSVDKTITTVIFQRKIPKNLIIIK